MECDSTSLHFWGSDFWGGGGREKWGSLICLRINVGGWGSTVLKGGGDCPPGIAMATGAYEVVWLSNQVTWSRSGTPQTFPMMVGLICQTCVPLGVWVRRPWKPPHMFTSSRRLWGDFASLLLCVLVWEGVNFSLLEKRLNQIDTLLILKLLHAAHSLSSPRISGPHWEVSLMTHKHISVTFMWNRAY